MSQRTLDSNLESGAQSSEFKYVVLVDLAFPSGNVRVHNGVGTHSFAGNDYLGVGAFGNIEAIEETTDLIANPVKLILSSITPEIIDAVKTDDVYGRDADIYLGALDESDQLEGTPSNWISGYMEHPSLAVGKNNAVIITVLTRAAKLKQRNNKRWTLEDHQAEFSGDLFLEFLPYVQEAAVPWGGEQVRTGYRNDVGLTGSGNDRSRRDRNRGRR